MIDLKDPNIVIYNNKKVTKRSMWSKTSPDMVNGVTLTINASYGNYQTPIRKNMFFIGDDTVIYLAGKHVVEYDIIRKRQSYITKNIEDEAVTAMNYYRTKKNVLKIGVGLKGNAETVPHVKVYNTSKNYTYSLINPEFPATASIIDMAFGLKGKYLLALTELEKNEKYVGTLWYVEKERVSGHFTVPSLINRVDVNPRNSTQFSVSGKAYFRIWEFDITTRSFEINKESLNVFAALEQHHIVDHCWIPENNFIVAATNENVIFIYSTTEMIMKYNFDYFPQEIKKEDGQNADVEENNITSGRKSQTVPRDYSISCLEPTSKGFVVGLKKLPAICLFEIDKNNELINLGSFRNKEDNVYDISSISTSADDLYLAVSILSSNRQAASLEKSNDSPTLKGSVLSKFIQNLIHYQEDDTKKKLDLFIFNKAVVDAVKSIQKDPYEPLFDKGVHGGPIKTIALCPSKTIMASLAEDSTIKFWEFGNDYRELYSCFFHDNPECIAIHPLAIQVAMGFSEGLRFYSFLEEDLRLMYTQSNNIRSCNALAYSEGGNYLAAGNGQSINIYDPYSFDILATLPGHSGTVKDIQWLHNDRYILTNCTYGIIFVWNNRWGREIDVVYRSHKCYAVAYDAEHDILVACGDDGKTRISNEKGSNMLLEYDSTPAHYTAVLISKRYQAIFFGTNLGSIRVYLWPPTEFTKDSLEYIEFRIHQSSITSLSMSHDNSYLITAGEDGAIFLMKMKEFVDGADSAGYDVLNALNSHNKKREFMGKFINTYLLNNLSVVGKINMDAKRDQIKELEFKIQNTKSDIEDEKEKLINYYSQKVKSVEEKNRDAIIKHKELMAQSMEEAEDAIRKMNEDREVMKRKYEIEFANLEEKNKQSLLKLYQKNDELKSQAETLKNYCDVEIRKFEGEYDSTLKEAEIELNQKYHHLVENYNSAVGGMKLDERKFKEALQQSEEDYDREFDLAKEKLVKEYQDCLKKSEDFRTLNARTTKENDKFRERFTNLDALIRDINAQNEQLEKDKQAFIQKLAHMQKQLTEREEIINQKEQQIKDYRNKNIHLQNFRSVYDHRVTTLNEEHGPLVGHLENMEKHIKTIYKELLDEANSQRRLREQVDERDTKIQELSHATMKKADLVQLFRRANELFEYDVTNLIRDCKYETWEEPLKRIKEIYSEKLKSLDQTIFENPTNMNNTIYSQYKDKAEEGKQHNIMQAIREELSRQRDFMNKKLLGISKFNDRAEDEREDAQIRIQNENTNLINECNFLRKEKHVLTNKIGMLEKQARDLARELDDSYLDQFRTRFNTNVDSKEKLKTQTLEPMHSGPTQKPITVRQSAELPFSKYKSQKNLQPLSQSVSTTSLRKAQTNDILYSLLKEIDKYNDAQVRQKVIIDGMEAKMKNSLISDKRSEDATMKDVMQSITLSPHKKGDQSPTGIGASDQSAFRSVRESKDWDIRRFSNGTIDSEKVTIVDQKKAGAMNFLSSSSVNSSIDFKNHKKP